MKYQEFLKRIRKIANGIYPHEIYYPLTAYKVKYITEQQISRIKYCAILDRLGLNVSIGLIADLEEAENHNNVGTGLARLGDKRVLFLIGYEESTNRNRLIYQLNDNFREMLNLNYDSIDNLGKELSKEGIQFG